MHTAAFFPVFFHVVSVLALVSFASPFFSFPTENLNFDLVRTSERRPSDPFALLKAQDKLEEEPLSRLPRSNEFRLCGILLMKRINFVCNYCTRPANSVLSIENTHDNRKKRSNTKEISLNDICCIEGKCTTDLLKLNCC